MLLEEDVYEAAYPLHDQLVREQDAGDPETWNDRMVRVQASPICRQTLFSTRNCTIIGRSSVTNSVSNQLERSETITANVWRSILRGSDGTIRC